MKIVSVSHYYPPHTGGLEIVARNLAESLAHGGHEVSVVACAARGERGGVTRERGVTVHRTRALNVFDRRFGIPFPVGGVGLLITLWREIASADIVWVHDVLYEPSWIAYLCSFALGKPIITTQHVGLVLHPSRFVMAVEKVVFKIWGTRIFRASARVVAHNHAVEEFLLSRGMDEKKILVLPNGVDLSLFRPPKPGEREKLRALFGLPAARLLVLCVGRFVPKKGFETLFDAKDGSYDLVFAGSGEVPERWKRATGVHVFHALAHERLAGLYRACDVFALPAQGEILTLAMQEAMASGLPIVTTNEPAYAAHVLDGTLIAFVEPSAQALKEALTRIIRDEALRARMSAYALLVAQERFNWNKNVKHLVALSVDVKRKQREVLVTTSWDDGHLLDLKLASLMRKYGITGTFYIAPENAEIPPSERLREEHVAALANDFEIGAHTLTHPRLSRLPDARAAEEIRASKAMLERWARVPVRSFCYPAGAYAERHARMVKESGFQSARTTKRFSLSRGANRYALPTSVHTYDHWSDLWSVARFSRGNPLRFFRYFRRWDELAIALFERVLERGGVFHLWGHSWEIEARGEWQRLERVFRHIANRPGASYIVNAELFKP